MSETVLQEALEKFNKFNKNSEWFQRHYDELKDKYKNQYVAINTEIDDTAPVDYDENFKSLIKRLRDKYGDLTTFDIEPVYELLAWARCFEKIQYRIQDYLVLVR